MESEQLEHWQNCRKYQHGFIMNQNTAKEVKSYCIYHAYDLGDQRVYLASSDSAINAKNVALFLQFNAELFFGESAWLSNQGIADLMCQFYGFHLCDPTGSAETIDMYSDREFATTSSIYGPLMADPALQRDGLQEKMRDYILPSNSDHIFDGDDSDVDEAVTVDVFQYELAPPDSADVYCIEHFYDMGDQRIYIKRASGDIDAKRAAMYCQFKCEEWFGPEKMLTNLGIASLLITFYGYQHSSVSPSTTIDMHADRNAFCGDNYTPLVSDASLHRDRLYEFMAPHVIG